MAGGNVPGNLKPIFIAAGRQYHIPPAVLAGVASVESNLGANATTSSAGAVGLMQFLPSTARGIGINPLNPRQAIFGAAKLLNQYGYQQNALRAIGAYNGGPGNPQYGYANQVMSEAKRLSSELAGGGGVAAGVPGPSGSVATRPVTLSASTTANVFDQKAFAQAQRQSIAGQFLSKTAASDPYDIGPKIPGLSSGSGGFSLASLFPTTDPNPSDYVSAQKVLQSISGTALAPHQGALPGLPSASGGGVMRSSGTAGGFLPAGAKYTANRQDQGRDGQTNPGGAIIAPGDGYVIRVASDPAGFGPSYPIVHFTSGRFAGKDMYVGHTYAVVHAGQHFRAGQVLSHTGTHGVGNATTPGWFEIGYAPGGTPGAFGQPAPF